MKKIATASLPVANKKNIKKIDQLIGDNYAYLFIYCFWSDALQVLCNHFSDFYTDSLKGVVIKGC